MQTSQDKLQSTIDKQLLELKELTEKTAMVQIQPVKATIVESLQGPPTSREEVFAKDCTNTVLIPPGIMRFPVSMLDVQIKVIQPIEVNLAQFPIEKLQMGHQ